MNCFNWITQLQATKPAIPITVKLYNNDRDDENLRVDFTFQCAHTAEIITPHAAQAAATISFLLCKNSFKYTIITPSYMLNSNMYDMKKKEAFIELYVFFVSQQNHPRVYL